MGYLGLHLLHALVVRLGHGALMVTQDRDLPVGRIVRRELFDVCRRTILIVMPNGSGASRD
jgi:hypothetical protein